MFSDERIKMAMIIMIALLIAFCWFGLLFFLLGVRAGRFSF